MVEKRKKMKPNPFEAPSVADATGTTKAQRDQWWAAFWQTVDKDPEMQEMMRRLQDAGCDLPRIAVAMHSYVTDGTKKLNSQRKERGKRAKKIFAGHAQSAKQMEDLHRAYGRDAEADKFAADTAKANELSAQAKNAYGTKRLGVNRSWTDLNVVEGLVFEKTNAYHTAQELVNLIKTARSAAGQTADVYETNPEIIRKGLKNFKKLNPLLAWLWTNPSQKL